MFTIKVISNFSSAHNLRGYQGKCEALHGHNWKVELTVSRSALDKLGMIFDFKTLKAMLNDVLEKLDHRYLNSTPYFKKFNPTSEHIARYIYRCLKPALKKCLVSVTVWENDSSCATYCE